jgi:hypothetical protein
VISGQQEGETKAYQGKYYQNFGIKVSLGYITENPQGEKQDVDGTDTVHHGNNEQKLGYMGLLFPKFQKFFHKNSSK